MTKKKLTLADFGRTLLCKAMQKILAAGGNKPVKELRAELESEEGANIPADFKGNHPSVQMPKWIVAIYSVAEGFAKAGFLTRESGIWGVTPAGEDALSQGDAFIIQKAKEAARELNKQRAKVRYSQSDGEDSDDEQIENNPQNAAKIAATIKLDDRQDDERESIRKHVLGKSADWLYGEHLAAALLGALGYETTITKRARDGGYDVIATTDEGLGFGRVWAEVKNHQKPIGAKMMREFAGVLEDKDAADAGVFISFSGFSLTAEEFASRNKKIRLMDGNKFIDLWCQHYDKLSDKDKALLPVKPIYFLDSEKLADDDSEE